MNANFWSRNAALGGKLRRKGASSTIQDRTNLRSKRGVWPPSCYVRKRSSKRKGKQVEAVRAVVPAGSPMISMGNIDGGVFERIGGEGGWAELRGRRKMLSPSTNRNLPAFIRTGRSRVEEGAKRKNKI